MASVKIPVVTTTGRKRAWAYVNTIQFKSIKPMPISSGYHPFRPEEMTSKPNPAKTAMPPSHGSVSNPLAADGVGAGGNGSALENMFSPLKEHPAKINKQTACASGFAMTMYLFQKSFIDQHSVTKRK